MLAVTSRYVFSVSYLVVYDNVFPPHFPAYFFAAFGIPFHGAYEVRGLVL